MVIKKPDQKRKTYMKFSINPLYGYLHKFNLFDSNHFVTFPFFTTLWIAP
jgi:hypothetical protein